VDLAAQGLSRREQEICAMLLEGRTIRQIALELNISFDTANSHYRSIYRKLGVSSKADLFLKFGAPAN
jgi:DNA-binding CsgD family transcriptional regulator